VCFFILLIPTQWSNVPQVSPGVTDPTSTFTSVASYAGHDGPSLFLMEVTTQTMNKNTFVHGPISFLCRGGAWESWTQTKKSGRDLAVQTDRPHAWCGVCFVRWITGSVLNLKRRHAAVMMNCIHGPAALARRHPQQQVLAVAACFARSFLCLFLTCGWWGL
jgi:hypothetical protein